MFEIMEGLGLTWFVCVQHKKVKSAMNARGTSSSSSSGKEDLNTAFKLIEEGHHHKEKAEHWLASRKYAEAAQRLAQLRKRQPHDTTEQIKIATLYHTQAIEFLKAARLSLVAALQQDTMSDHGGSDETSQRPPTSQNNDPPPLLHTNNSDNKIAQISDISSLLQTLTEKDFQNRLELFGRLFAKEELLLPSLSSSNQQSVEDEASKLEERLLQLNNSIPRFLKTEAEKIRDLNRGLRRLGLATVESPSSTTTTQSALFSPTATTTIVPPKSETDQVNDIINQVKDEVIMNHGELLAEQALLPPTSGSQPQDENIEEDIVVSAHDDDDEDEVEDNEAEEDNANLTSDVCRSIYDKLLSVQVSLAELIALFEVDAGGDAEIEFDPSRGRHLLNDARAQLKMVQEQWDNNNSSSA